ncbi:GNAT family N-acetyltransferase [Pectobacterium brasiliense]|uniref:GNAT family N-acetyltransferase n=1 Tax=Pectobacterium brasiliense TaxID=180957 RepID=UPI0015DE492D|nr:GNAT family N-acetyltransferase [Pectobacterium brasiliense]MBA0218800.1 GNAT family N-acetyltransferase [Pectobacterium brasiliense]MBN3073190.1 GNAT family N-acetyltransferase [Pectobacterium brasiliense]MBN3170611.1 GNAT family N-acetyltransferase [Pectobacterium brasiliense]
MTSEQQDNVKLEGTPGYVDRPRLEILHIYEREKPDQYWKTVLIETIYENTQVSNTINKDKISIFFRFIGTKQNSKLCFKAIHRILKDKDNVIISETISLTGGELGIWDDNYKGNRLGRWLFNEIVSWAKQWPNADVNSIRLGPKDATEDNLERRNKMYTGAGLEFDYDDDEKRTGRSREMKASKLIVLSSWKKENGGNIAIQNIDDYINNLIKENKSLKHEMENKKLSINSLNQKISMMESKTIKEMLRRALRNVIKFLNLIFKNN